jgi:hypothetical protein
MIINKSKAKQNKNLLTIVFLCNAHHLQVLGGYYYFFRTTKIGFHKCLKKFHNYHKFENNKLIYTIS